MSKLLAVTSILISILTGCSLFSKAGEDLQSITRSKVQNPFFFIPPENLQDYQAGVWILLAESKNYNWFYNPYTLFENEDGIVSFNTFVTERAYQDQLHPFNSTSTGPYLQKIDCFGNYQWSETFYAEHMPNQETYVNPLTPLQEWGWIKIKPKTSMAYIRARVCGRKFIDDQNKYYFLFQQGRMPFVKDRASASKLPVTKDLTEAWVAQFRVQNAEDVSKVIEVAKRYDSNTPVFYDVVNNEVKVINAKNAVRQMRLVSYNMDKDFSKRDGLVFQANCQSNTYKILGGGFSAKTEALSSSKEDLPNVAFNRACGDHGLYMQLGSKNK